MQMLGKVERGGESAEKKDSQTGIEADHHKVESEGTATLQVISCKESVRKINNVSCKTAGTL